VARQQHEPGSSSGRCKHPAALREDTGARWLRLRCFFWQVTGAHLLLLVLAAAAAAP
jgi:hypothetical protein